MVWEPFALAVLFGLLISAGIYFVVMWPQVAPDDDDDGTPAVATAAAIAEAAPPAAAPPADDPPAADPAASADVEPPAAG